LFSARRARVAALLMMAAAWACGPVEQKRAAGTPPPSPSSAAFPSPPATLPVVLFLGTSLTAGQGLDPGQAYPALIQKKIDAAGLAYRVVNAGVGGDTSADALGRLEWLLRQKVDVLVLETGANDALRGQDPAATRENIRAILARAREHSPAPRLVLVGMEAPRNLGADYVRRFRAIYPELARESGAALVPFLLEGVGGVESLNQADGIHPTAAGHQRMADTVWRVLEPLLRRG
jgi:acyl-CoA thioesterase I